MLSMLPFTTLSDEGSENITLCLLISIAFKVNYLLVLIILAVIYLKFMIFVN